MVSLDIGTSKIQSLAAYLSPEGSKLEVISKVSKSSFGVRRGVVVDSDKVSDIVSKVLMRTQKAAGQKFDEVFITLNGSHLRSTDSTGTIAVSRADQVVSDEDVKRVKNAAQTFPIRDNWEILRVFPQEYKVDKEGGVKKPVGMKGVRLQVKILALLHFVPYFENLTEAVLNAGWQIGHVMAKPLASAEAVSTPRERELGVMVVNIGSGTTGYAVYKEGVLKKTGVVPVGSFNVTKDIGVGLRTDVDTAEEIKLKFGKCGMRGNKKLEIEEKKSEKKLTFSKSELGRIIDPRLKEIFKLVKEDWQENGSLKLPGGVVVTGGGANMPGISEMAKEEMEIVSRIGTPQGFSPSQKDPSLAAVCGLCLQAKKFREMDRRGINGKVLKKLKSILKDFIP